MVSPARAVALNGSQGGFASAAIKATASLKPNAGHDIKRCASTDITSSTAASQTPSRHADHWEPHGGGLQRCLSSGATAVLSEGVPPVSSAQRPYKPPTEGNGIEWMNPWRNVDTPPSVVGKRQTGAEKEGAEEEEDSEDEPIHYTQLRCDSDDEHA